MRLLLFSLFFSYSYAATIEGQLINGTSGGEGYADTVRLVRLTQTMEPVAQAEKVTGLFRLTYDGPTDGSFLVQAMVGSTTYSYRLADLTQPVAMTVYEQGPDVPIDVRIGSIAVYANGDKVDVGVFYNLDNNADPKMARAGDTTFEFAMPSGFDEVHATSRREGVMPLRQNLRREDGNASITYSLKPGRTQLIVTYSYAYTAQSGLAISLPLPATQESMHVLALPGSLTLDAPGLEFVSYDEQEDVQLYDFLPPKGETAPILNLMISGEPAPAAKEQAHGQQQLDVQNKPSNISQWRWHILGALLVVMGGMASLGFRRY